jgi:hypothetical protein
VGFVILCLYGFGKRVGWGGSGVGLQKAGKEKVDCLYQGHRSLCCKEGRRRGSAQQDLISFSLI